MLRRNHLALTSALALALAIAGASSNAADGSLPLLAAGAPAASPGPGGSASSTVAVPIAAALPAAASLVDVPSPLAATLPSTPDTLAAAGDGVELMRLAALAPGLDPDVLALGLKAMRCAQRGGIAPQANRLAVIDYSLSSRTKRLWVFDLAAGSLLMHEPVAHGKNSGEDMTTSFSNTEGSLQTSLGLFVTGDTYQGGNGYSLRMEGLEPGFNDQAMSRAIVMHGAPYVDLDMAAKNGRLGRSWGCPAVRDEIAREMIDQLKGGQFVFSYFPDDAWKTRSALLNCGG